MKSHISFLAELYRELVGLHGSRDLPQSPPIEGYYFCPMPTVNKLWASITFAYDYNCGAVATLEVYSPDEGSEGKDPGYLFIHGRRAFPDSSHSIISDYLDEENPARNPARVAECKVIQVLLNRKVNEAYPTTV